MQQVTKDMQISEVLRMDMSTANIFLGFGMHCIGCPMASSESIEAACATHGIDPEEVVKKLNEHLSNK